MEPGQVVVVCGCMFAGKTSQLIDMLHVAQTAQRRVRAFKHCLDDRYCNSDLVTHDRQVFAALPVAAAAELCVHVEGVDVVCIDEVHFFGPDLVPVVADLRDAGHDVIVGGLEYDAWGQPFPHVQALLELADEVLRLTTPCSVCGRPACYSQRMVPLRDDDMVGGPGDYEPRCNCCFEPLPPPAPVYAV